MAELVPSHSPMPAMRNRITVPSQLEVLQARSPVPTPRNINNRSVEPSPDVRRRTEQPTRSRNVSQVQSDRTLVEQSPTAQLIHKLFRNRDPRLLPDHPSEISPLTPTNSRRIPQRLPELRITEESIYSEIPTAPIPTEPDDDSDSEYLSIDNLSLMNLDSIRVESVTPPPAYRSIYDDEK